MTKKIYDFKQIEPKIGNNVLIQDGAKIIGDVRIEDNVGIWFNAVLRGDLESITLKKGCNVQENCSVHNDKGFPVIVGENATIGHNSVVHGAIIGANTVVGMGSVLLNGAKVGANCLIGAGSLVTGSSDFKDGMLIMGSPAKEIRPLKENELAYAIRNGNNYQKLALEYLKELK